MKYKRFIIILFILFILLTAFCCDRSGNLSEKETNALYSELKTDFQDGKLWELESVFFHQEKDIDDSILFLKSTIEATFEHQEFYTGIYGNWFDKKSNCKALAINCQIQYGEEKDYIIDRLVVAKYYDRESFKIWLYWHRVGEGKETHNIEVVLQ